MNGLNKKEKEIKEMSEEIKREKTTMEGEYYEADTFKGYTWNLGK
jgi:hypothetical protein